MFPWSSEVGNEREGQNPSSHHERVEPPWIRILKHCLPSVRLNTTFASVSHSAFMMPSKPWAPSQHDRVPSLSERG